MRQGHFNILYFSSFADLWGGGQVSLLQLVKNINRNRFSPFVVIPSEGELSQQLKQIQVPVIILDMPSLLPFPTIRSLRCIKRLLKLSKDLDIRLLHTDGPRNTFYAVFVKVVLRIPLIWHIRASNRDIFDRILFHFCNSLIIVAGGLKERFGWVKAQRKLVTVYNGIDIESFSPFKRRSVTPLNPLDKAEELVVGMIGRVEKLKGQKTLIEACGRLPRLKSSLKIMIIGEIIDPLYAKEIIATARGFGVEKNVCFLGYRKDICHLLHQMDIYTFTSVFDAFPRTIIEAMAAGLPVITTDVGGCPEAVKEGVTGYIVPKGDPIAFADRIAFLANRPEKRIAMGEKARERARKKFSVEENVRKTEQLYIDILSKHAIH